MNFTDTLQLMMGLFIPMAIGYFLFKFKMVDKSFIKGLSVLLYNVSLPCSILDSMMQKVSRSELLESSVLPLMALVMVVSTLIMGVIVSSVIEKNTDVGRHGYRSDIHKRSSESQTDGTDHFLCNISTCD